MKAIQVSSLILPLLAGLAGCSEQPAKPRLGEVDRLPHVQTLQPRYASRETTVELLATVDPFEKAQLCAQVQGEVKDLSADIDIGRAIKKGEELLTLDIPAIKAEQENKNALLTQAMNLRDQAIEALNVADHEVKEAEAQVKRYEADLTFRDTALRRVRTLAAKGTIQPQLVEEAELQRDSAKAAFEAARVTVRTKKAKLKSAEVEQKVAASRIKVAEADLKLINAKVGFATIKAPFDGTITNRWVDNGAIIKDPGAPLLTVMRTDRVRVIIHVPERYVPLIRATESKDPGGQANLVRLKIRNFDQYLQVEGRITRTAKNLDDVTRLMRAEIHIENNDKTQLRPGMSGTATVVLDEGKTNKLTVPSTALVRVGEEIRVYYVDDLTKQDPPRGKVKMAVVEIGQDDGKTVEILSGLKGHELVIAKGNGVVRAGETAIPVKARERADY
jgi:RND family efflux transporter MFP subunit